MGFVLFIHIKQIQPFPYIPKRREGKGFFVWDWRKDPEFLLYYFWVYFQGPDKFYISLTF
jgi:hypothetical protein